MTNQRTQSGSPSVRTRLAGTQPGVQPQGGAMLIHGRSFGRPPGAANRTFEPPSQLAASGRGRRRIVVLGTPVTDIQLNADAVAFDGQKIEFDCGGARREIEFAGQAPGWGGKGTATKDLSGFRDLPGVRTVTGGGSFNSVQQLDRWRRERGLRIDIEAVSTSTSSPDLEAIFESMNVSHTSLGLAPMASNAVITNGHVPPERVVARSPTNPPGSLNGGARLLGTTIGPAAALLINSPKSDEAAERAVESAAANGIPIYTVLTPSTGLSWRRDRMLSPGETAACNLSEFAELARDRGINCPTEEKQENLLKITQAVSAISKSRVCADLVVTVGEQGSIVGDATTGLIAHVALAPWARSKVRSSVPSDRINGSGDRFFAVFALEHLLYRGVPTENSRALWAARRASEAVVNSYSRFLKADRSWFTVRILPERFCR